MHTNQCSYTSKNFEWKTASKNTYEIWHDVNFKNTLKDEELVSDMNIWSGNFQNMCGCGTHQLEKNNYLRSRGKERNERVILCSSTSNFF